MKLAPGQSGSIAPKRRQAHYFAIAGKHGSYAAPRLSQNTALKVLPRFGAAFLQISKLGTQGKVSDARTTRFYFDDNIVVGRVPGTIFDIVYFGREGLLGSRTADRKTPRFNISPGVGCDSTGGVTLLLTALGCAWVGAMPSTTESIRRLPGRRRGTRLNQN